MEKEKGGVQEKKSYLENDYCEFWIDETGIIHEIFKQNFEILTLDIAKKITAARLSVSDGITRPLFVELGHAVKMERAANKYLSTGIAMDHLSATGILVKDQIEKLGASIYIRFFPPSIPTKFFTNKEKALTWLRSQNSK